MRLLDWLNERRSWLRWLLKSLTFVVVAFLVLFPRLDRLWTQLQLPLNRNELIDQDSPALVPLIQEFDTTRDPSWERRTLLKKLEGFVRKKIRYDFDWNVWGNVDYFPTVEEAIEKGREDCDGQAVVAASLMRHYGFKAWMTGDFSHIWVKTDIGPAMSPGKTEAFRTADGRRKFNWKILKEIPQHLGLGISIFPLKRELILVLTAWLLLLGSGSSLKKSFKWLLLLVIGLLLIREGGRPRAIDLTKVDIGLVLWFVVIAAMLLSAKRKKKLPLVQHA